MERDRQILRQRDGGSFHDLRHCRTVEEDMGNGNEDNAVAGMRKCLDWRMKTRV